MKPVSQGHLALTKEGAADQTVMHNDTPIHKQNKKQDDIRKAQSVEPRGLTKLEPVVRTRICQRLDPIIIDLADKHSEHAQ